MDTEKILSFSLPEAIEVETFAIKTKDGRVIIRSGEELKKVEKPKE